MMVRGDKTEAMGISGHVLIDLKKPLEDLVTHSGVEAINPGKSFHRRRGENNGMSIGIYDSNTKRLKLNCQTKRGGQEVYVIVNKSNLDDVKSYIKELNERYFK